MRVGVIADTHGWVHPAVVHLFAGVDHILHAGDVGSWDVLRALGAIAPVTAVRGNVDEGRATAALPLTADVVLAGRRVHVVHRLDPAAVPSVEVVVFGHTHRIVVERRGGALWLNPGAAGRRGFHRELSVALLDLGAEPPATEVIILGPRSATPAVSARATGTPP